MRRLYQSLWIASVLVVVVLSLLPRSNGAVHFLDSLPMGDKLQHGMAYLPLAFFPALYQSVGRAAISIAGMALLGVALELGQSFSPGRSPDPADALSDCVGLLLGAVAAILLRHSFLRQELP